MREENLHSKRTYNTFANFYTHAHAELEEVSVTLNIMYLCMNMSGVDAVGRINIVISTNHPKNIGLAVVNNLLSGEK